MLLPLYLHPHSFSSKTLDLVPLFFPSLSIKTLYFQNPKPSKFIIRSSTADPKTVSKSAIQRISEKLRNLGYLEENSKENEVPETGQGSPGEIFIPFSHELPKHRVGYTIDSSWSTPENPLPAPGSGAAIRRFHELKIEVEKQKKSARKEERAPSLAELAIPEQELKRLREIGIELKKRLKVGKAGVTEGIVNGIHERWRRSELVKIKCEDLCRMNMKRTHDILERKTGGLVIWRSGSIIILYRGANYEYPYFLADTNTTNDTFHDVVSLESSQNCEVDGGEATNSSCTVSLDSAGLGPSNRTNRSSLVHGVGSPDKVRFQLPGEMELVEEADHLLDGLGPRFTDWWGYDPLPIDADLLPAIVPGFRRPFRLLPYGIKDKLTNDEMTILRRLSRPLPCHFALGRNRNLQGLGASIVKLWEKCEIAKIAVKRGVQNTNSEMMAEELKRLTGGTLLSRDREFIVFYRGKDFLPPAVSTAIKERGKHGIHRQKMDDSLSIDPVSEPSVEPTEPASVDELEETNDKKKRNIVSEEIKVRSTKSAIKRISTKLSVTLEKKVKAEKLLAELEKAAEPIKSEVDREGITKEERYMLRKVGLRMKPFLLLGRRGVFDGTVENMHLHWKYRELVKIISKDRCIEDVHGAARTLEAESGGILVAVERVNKGYAIIVYRGKNYQRPADLRPQTLLNKREAMKRSLEAQRRESLKLHVLNLTRNIDQLELQLVKDNLDTNFVQSTESKISDNKFESSDSNTNFESSEFCGSLESAHDQENVEATKGHGADSSTMHSNDCMNASNDSEETTEQVEPKDSFSQYEIRATEYELESSSESVLKETHSKTILDGSVDRGDSDPISHSENSHLSQGGMTCSANDNDTTHASDNERKELSVETARNKLRSSIHRGVEKGDNRVFSRAVPLSNRDRLVLRKQALKMKKRPVLAVGRNNVITGVAKAIRTHFQKNPLAIVNIKGRAKGTSIQEVVFKLEQATGAVLVSQEPNKVILYRGWGEGEEPGGAMKGKRSSSITSPGKEDRATLVAPPQLIAAIRLECGLQSSQEGEVTL